MHHASRALDGIRVLDLSRFIAGPQCTMLLADMGAEVIKVESPKGELTRRFPPHVDGDSVFYMVLNRNKKGVTLDPWHETGKAVLRDLIATCDVVVENYRPGVMAAMGFGYEEIRAIDPSIVMVSISGFGQDGPWAERGCFDAIGQAASGLMSVTGWPEGPPTVAGTFVVDYLTAAYAAFATAVAIHHRARTGEGQWIDTCLLDSAVSTLITYLPAYLLDGTVTGRAGNHDRFIRPATAYRAADGYVYVSVGPEAHVARAYRIVGAADGATGPGSCPTAKRERAAELEQLITSFVATRPCAEVVAVFEREGIPVAKVASVDEVACNPQVLHRGLMAWTEHPTAGAVPLPATPFKLSATPGAIRSAPPSLGQHNDEVYRTLLGYPRERICEMERAGVI
jgi:crotonobetainyl-CoA:carnitine CoA-transferase CaiB-like acyl-CoA transferase